MTSPLPRASYWTCAARPTVCAPGLIAFSAIIGAGVLWPPETVVSERATTWRSSTMLVVTMALVPRAPSFFSPARPEITRRPGRRMFTRISRPGMAPPSTVGTHGGATSPGPSGALHAFLLTSSVVASNEPAAPSGNPRLIGVTASRLNCLGPTLCGGRLTAAYEAPPRLINRANVATTFA